MWVIERWHKCCYRFITKWLFFSFLLLKCKLFLDRKVLLSFLHRSGFPRTAAEDQEGAAQPVFRAKLQLQSGAPVQAPVWREMLVQRQVSARHAPRCSLICRWTDFFFKKASHSHSQYITIQFLTILYIWKKKERFNIKLFLLLFFKMSPILMKIDKS